MGRIQGLTEVYLTADALLKPASAPVEVHDVVIGFIGAAAGQQLTLRDGQDGTAPPLVVFVLDAANGTISKSFKDGKRFENGCFVDFQNSGAMHVSLTYK